MHDPDEEEIEEFARDNEMFSVSGVKFEMKQNTRRRTIALIMIGPEDTDWNLMRFYLALDHFKRQMENEMHIMEEPADEQ